MSERNNRSTVLCVDSIVPNHVVSTSRAAFSLRTAGLHRGMDRDLLGYYSHWEVEDIQAITKGWYDDEPLFPGWESTKNFRDTGELAGFATSRNPEQARKELEEMSDVFPESDEDALEGGGGSDDEEDGRRGVPNERWGTIGGLTPNER